MLERVQEIELPLLFPSSSTLVEQAANQPAQDSLHAGRLLSLGFILFSLSFVVDGFASYYATRAIVVGEWLYLVFGILSTTGLMTMSTAEIDVNRFCRQHQLRTNAMVIVWVVSYATYAFEDSHVFWIPNLPFFYYALRYKHINTFLKGCAKNPMSEGYPMFTELLQASLCLGLIANALMAFFPQISGEPDGPRWIALVGAVDLIGAVAMAFVSYHNAPWRPGNGPPGQAAAIQFFITVYVYLFFFGMGQLTENAINHYVYHLDVGIQLWLFCVVHILPPSILLCSFGYALVCPEHKSIRSNTEAGSGTLFTVAMLAFVLADFGYSLGYFMLQSPFFLLVQALVQAVASIVMTTSDLRDPNRYLQSHQLLAFAFAASFLAWCLLSAFNSIMIYALPALPFLYLLCRWREVMALHDGYLRYTQLLALGLALDVVSWGVDDMIQALAQHSSRVWFIWLKQGGDEGFDEPISPVWPLILVGCVSLSGGILMLRSFIQSTQRKGQALLMGCWVMVYAWNCMWGLHLTLHLIVQYHVYNGPSASTGAGSAPAAGPALGFVSAAVHMILPFFVFWYRGTILSKLGKRWLRSRMLQADHNYDGIHIKRGCIAEVEHAIEGGLDLNALYNASYNDAVPTAVRNAAAKEVSGSVPEREGRRDSRKDSGRDSMRDSRKDSGQESSVVSWASSQVSATRVSSQPPLTFSARRSRRSSASGRSYEHNDAFTLLILAAFNGHVDSIQRLLSIGSVEIDKGSSHHGETAVLVAARRGHAECVLLLVQHGCDLNKPTGEGLTPLVVASAAGHKDIVSLLAQHGARGDDKGFMGITAADAATHM
jgi:hypothetical protein